MIGAEGLCDYDPIALKSDYKYLSKLGSGAFGSVHLAVGPGRQKVVIKEICAESLDDSDFICISGLRVPKEIQILHRLKGYRYDVVHMIKWFIYDEMRKDKSGHIEFDEHDQMVFDDVYVIVFEWDECIEMDLYDYIRKKGILSEKESKFIIGQLIRIWNVIRERERIIFRDNKDQNILLRIKDKKVIGVTICDVGGSFSLDDIPPFSWQQGTAVWNSPQWFQGNRYNWMYDYAWVIGVFIYAMLTDRLPFDDDKFPKKIPKGKRFLMLQELILSKEPVYPRHMSRACVNLIKLCLKKNEEDRICFTDIEAHAWFCSEEEEVEII